MHPPSGFAREALAISGPEVEHAVPAESRFVILRDQSSSMAWVPEFPRIWNEQISDLAQLVPECAVTIYEVTSVIRKCQDCVSARELEPLSAEKWFCGRGGLLSGGSALADAVLRGCHKVFQFRTRGFDGPIGLFLFTDGWSKDDRHPHSLAKKWLQYAREDMDATFRIFGFPSPQTEKRLRVFVEDIGVRPDEDQRIYPTQV